MNRNRDEPIGYKLSVIEFSNGEPVAPADSNNATIDVLTNPDIRQCPDNCFRPVGLAWDSQGRLYMSSDSTGEIYIVVRSDGSSADDATPTSGPPPTNTGPAASASSTGSATSLSIPASWATFGIVALLAGLFA
jgi:hypothetical protein